MVGDSDVNVPPLRLAFRFLLEAGAKIELIGDADVPSFEFEGQPVSTSQFILKAYAAGMAEAA